MTIAKLTQRAGYLIGGLMLVILILVGFGVNHIREGGAIDVEGERLIEFQTDILPPSAYLVEAFALASIMAIHEDSWDINDRRLAVAEEDYWEAQEMWAQSQLPAELKTALATSAQSDGKAFWEEINERLKPAAKKWDTQAVLASNRRLLTIYRSHRAANDEMVARSSELFKEVSDEGAATTSAVMTALALIGLTILAMIGFVYIGLKRRVLTPVAETAQTMNALAGGDLEVGRTSQHSNDEIGDMTRSIETFREALVSDKKRAIAQTEIVATLSTALDRLANGELDYRIKSMPELEVKEERRSKPRPNLREMYNTSIERLEQMIGSVRTTASGVQRSSVEIHAASEDLAQRNEQQAASLEQTAASMRAVTDLVRQTAESARIAQGSIAATQQQALWNLLVLISSSFLTVTTMRPKHSSIQSPQSVSQTLTGNNLILMTPILSMISTRCLMNCRSQRPMKAIPHPILTRAQSLKRANG
ncbi:MAG: HAMP domain-containing protein [Pseudomonadota bacterium]